jgi:amidase
MKISSFPAVVSRRQFFNASGRISATALFATLPSVLFAAPNSWSPAISLVSTDTETDPALMSATKLAQLIREKKISATAAVQANIDRIEKVNPLINAVVFKCYQRALDEAKAADAALASGNLFGPLHGVPFVIKDSIDTAGVVTTGGTVGRMHYIPDKDATAVARLRAAGAILLGKTNTPEWTLGGGGIPGIATTANIIHGITRNPHDLTRSTAGSSGGAGAIVAAGGASFDIGTDWGGSVRGPSHMCGIAGIKPTFGRIPRTGHIVDYGGIHDTWQQFGPMTRRVEDLILLMPILVGSDAFDAAIPPMPWADPSSVDLKSLRVAWYVDAPTGDCTPETITAVKFAAALFSDLGCKVVEDYPKALIEELTVIRSKISAESRHGLKRLAEKWGSKAVSPTVTGRYDRSGVTTPELTELLEKQDANRSKMLQWVKKYDLILNPVFGHPAAAINGGVDDKGATISGRGANFNGVHNTTGWPAAVVRASTSPEGLPIGVQLIGQPWRDDVVLAASAFVEKATGGWKAPVI